MRRRLILIVLIGAALLPTRWEARRTMPVNGSQSVAARALPIVGRRVGAARVSEAWVLSSANTSFGGYSALAITGPREFLLLSDHADVAQFALSPGGVVARSRLWRLTLNGRVNRSRGGRDSESLVRDPRSGQLWVGFEEHHRIIHFSRGFHSVIAEVAPPAMQRWPLNGGAEAMVGLRDGRFLVMAESAGGPGGGSDALLFARDPTMPHAPPPLDFAYDSAGRGLVTDATQLPDGRILLLHRRIDLLRGWVSTLAIADPATIRAGQRWQAQTLAVIDRDLVGENFEGVALEPKAVSRSADAVDHLSIWIVSDDNLAVWQRTLLLRLDLTLPAAPSGSTPARAGPVQPIAPVNDERPAIAGEPSAVIAWR